MTTIEQRAEAFDPYFDTLRGVREDRRRILGPDALRSKEPRYDEASQSDTALTLEMVESIDGLSVIDRAGSHAHLDKFMARVAICDYVVTGGDVTKQKALMRDGMKALDTVLKPFDFGNKDFSPIVAQLHKEAVTIYPASGAFDFQVDTHDEPTFPNIGKKQTLMLKYEHGVLINGHDGFSTGNVFSYDKTKSFQILGSLTDADDPFKAMRKWDPTDGAYDPAVIQLGSRDNPRALGDELTLTNKQRFALRAGARLLGQADWLMVGSPSEFYRQRMAQDFANVCLDLLIYGEPQDSKDRVIPAGRNLALRRSRQHSLAQYQWEELKAILHGADITVDTIRAVAKNDLKNRENNPRDLAELGATMSIRPKFRKFFDKMQAEVKKA